MTEFNNNLKFVPSAPKTYEVRYIENQGPSNLSKLASYLGIKTAECSGKEVMNISSVVKTADDAAKIIAAATKASAEVAAQYGGSSTTTIRQSGSVTVQYDSGK